MTKKDLVQLVAEETNVPQSNVKTVLECIITKIEESVAAGDPVYLRGFGSFVSQERKAKVARDFRNSGTIQIAAHTIPKFRPYDDFINLVNNGGSEE